MKSILSNSFFYFWIQYFFTLEILNKKWIRTFEEYEVLLKKSNWKIKKVFWTTPGLFPIKYIHFNLTK
jgi:hypothetical protein